MSERFGLRRVFTGFALAFSVFSWSQPGLARLVEGHQTSSENEMRALQQVQVKLRAAGVELTDEQLGDVRANFGRLASLRTKLQSRVASLENAGGSSSFACFKIRGLAAMGIGFQIQAAICTDLISTYLLTFDPLSAGIGASIGAGLFKMKAIGNRSLSGRYECGEVAVGIAVGLATLTCGSLIGPAEFALVGIEASIGLSATRSFVNVF